MTCLFHQRSLPAARALGLKQITDRPSAQKRVDPYLRGVAEVVRRQIDIEARLYDVTLNDQFQFGIDWEQAVIEQETVTSLTVGTILAITPQVAGDDWISLDISPVLTSLLETRLSPNGTTMAPVLDIKQGSTLIRVRSGSTIVFGGLIQTEAARSRRKIPRLGDIPLLERLFPGDFEARRKKELVIFITPRVVE